MYLCWSKESFRSALSHSKATTPGLGRTQVLLSERARERERLRRLEADRKKFPFILPCKCSKVWSRKSASGLVTLPQMCFLIQEGMDERVKTCQKSGRRSWFGFDCTFGLEGHICELFSRPLAFMSCIEHGLQYVDIRRTFCQI